MARQRIKKPVSMEHLNGWRMHRQLLDHPYTGKNIVNLVKSIGWIYSPGSSTPYLSLWARMALFRPRDLEHLVFSDFELIQVETLRGCTMLIPRHQAPIALRIRSRTFTELSKQARGLMPIRDSEMELLKAAILKALNSGPMKADRIEDLVPSCLVRPFAPELKRIGLSGSLPLAINLLKEEGKILKLQANGRLDSTDYCYVLLSSILPEVDPFALRSEVANSQLAGQYFKVEGPARIKDFAWWAGINVTDAMRAAAEVKPILVPVPIEKTKDEFLVSESMLDEFLDFRPRENYSINFIPYRDTFLKGQRRVVSRFVREEHADKPFSRWKGKLINDPLATVIQNGEVIGLWEWVGQDETVDFVLFDSSVPRSVERHLRKRASQLGDFIQKSLGGIRIQGLDYGRHQMTGIHELKSYWGSGVQANVPAL